MPEQVYTLSEQSKRDFVEMRQKVLGVRERGPVFGAAKPIEYNQRGGGEMLHRFKITGATQDGTNKRWVYAARRQVKTAGGYGGWTNDPEDSTSYSLFNSIEDMNAATGLYGAGVNSANLKGTYALQRIPDGAVVFALKLTFAVGEGAFTEYWFSGYNGVDGECP